MARWVDMKVVAMVLKNQLESVDDVGNGASIINCCGRGYRQGYLLAGQALGQGQREPGQLLLVAGLAVGWGGIVDVAAHAVVGEMGAEGLSVINTHHILVPNLPHVLKDDGCLHPGVGDALVVGSGDGTAGGVLVLQVAQLDTQHRRLDFIQATVVAHVDVVVTAVRAIVGKGLDTAG